VTDRPTAPATYLVPLILRDVKAAADEQLEHLARGRTTERYHPVRVRARPATDEFGGGAESHPRNRSERKRR
jgi:hypothetical protein